MPAHDAYLRRTPWEALLPDPEFPERHFPAIAEGIEAHPEAGDNPGAFALLDPARRALAELRDPRGGTADAGHTHALLLFHVWHLHQAGLPHLLVTVPVSRWAVEATTEPAADGAEEGGGAPASPTGGAGPGSAAGSLPDAAYVQLPQHLFWIREDAAEQPVSLDGFFRTVRGDTLHVLAVGGLHGLGGEGFRVLPLPGVPLADAPTWLGTAMREEGEDFRSEMPGAELEGLYEIRTAGELLKLVARLDRFVTRFPGGRVAGIPTARTGGDASSTEKTKATEPARGPDAGRPESPAGPVPGSPDYTRLILT